MAIHAALLLEFADEQQDYVLGALVAEIQAWLADRHGAPERP